MFDLALENVRYFEANYLRRNILRFLIIILSSLYIVWRFSIIDWNYPLYNGFYFLLELLIYIISMTHLIGAIRYIYHPIKPVPKGVEVDVVVTCYLEDFEIIKKTILAAKEIEYPHQTYLLDDGKRDEVKEYAQKIGVNYLRRQGNQGAKAGNVNAALPFLKGEFLLIFDCDHIANRKAIEWLLYPLIEHPNIAFVQAPQFYYNEQAFLFLRNKLVNLKCAHEQSTFFDCFQCKRDVYESAYCVGTGVMLRKSVLLKMGGFPEETITEDLHYTIKVHNAGYDSWYLNRPIAWGLDSEDMNDFKATRHRWTHGNFHAVRLESFWGSKKLKPMLTFLKAEMLLHKIAGFRELMLMLLPLVVICTDLAPFQFSPFNMAMIYGYFIIINLLSYKFNRPYQSYYSRVFYATGKIFIQFKSLVAFFKIKKAWKSSNKQHTDGIKLKDFPEFIVLIGLNLIAVYYFYFRFSEKYVHVYGAGGAIIFYGLSAFWAILNITKCLVWIFGSIRPFEKKYDETLFKVPLSIVNEHNKFVGNTQQLGLKQMIVDLKNEDGGGSWKILLPNGKVTLKVTEKRKDKVNHWKEGLYWASFEVNTKDEKEILMRHLYAVDWHWMLRVSRYCKSTVAEGLGGCWQPIHWQKNDGEYYWGMTLKDCIMPMKLVCSHRLNVGDEIWVYANEKRLKVQVVSEIQLEHPIPGGLHGAEFWFYAVNEVRAND
jgi:cellulose synthase (UDP-forming)